MVLHRAYASWFLCYYYYFNSSFFLTVNPSKITWHLENQSVAIGVNVEFSIQASGDNLHFQWQKNGNDLVNSGKYHGVHTNTLHIVAAECGDKGDYRCLVKSVVDEKFSNEAHLTVSK